MRKLVDQFENEKKNISENVSELKSKRGWKEKIIAFVILVLSFLQTLPIFIALMFWCLAILCVVILIVVILMVFSMLTSVLPPAIDLQGGNLNAKTGVGVNDRALSGKIEWTEEQLRASESLLDGREKNFYRLGILAKRALDGYGGPKLWNVSGVTDDQKVLLLMGVFSTESSMQFYMNIKDDYRYNIMEIPSDKGANGSGYGVYGLHASRARLEGYYPANIANTIKSMYTPKRPYNYEAQYLPFATAMSAKHTDNDLRKIVTTKAQVNKINAVMDRWGIKSNRDYFMGIVTFFLAQAEYHGATTDEYEHYLNFYAALYTATSDNDAERSFSKWEIRKGGYDEGSFRLAVIGAHKHRGLSGISTPLELKTAGGAAEVYLNGQRINEPIWKYIWKKHGGKNGLAEAWQYVRYLSGLGTGKADRVLNFHYGFNSLLQGERIYKLLASKVVSTGGAFRETPGKGQGIFAGKPTEEYIKAWYNSANPVAKIWVDSLKPYWGTSEHLANKNSFSNKGGYVDTRYGVPFYGQGSRFGEKYGPMRWHWGTSGTFNQSGCMIYSHAYVISALTGRLVNPAELAVVMASRGALVSAGIVSSNMYKIYNDLGLHSKYIKNAVANFNEIVKAVSEGKLAVVRVYRSPYTYGSNHFIVLNGLEEKDGKKYFSMYTSPYVNQSKSLHEINAIKNAMHLDAMIIWK